MSVSPLPLNSALGAFLLAFPALFSIVNPIAGSLTFSNVTADRTPAERVRLARLVGFYSLAILIGSLWLGSYVLNFFGISLGALRIAGGLVVAVRAWELLMAPEAQESRKQTQAAGAASGDDVAFFPLTMPFTTGPGAISVAVALGAERPASGIGTITFFVGVTFAAAAVALSVWVFYRFADRVMHGVGEAGARVTTRLVAFLLLCIGVQILVNGVEDLARPLLTHLAIRGS